MMDIDYFECAELALQKQDVDRHLHAERVNRVDAGEEERFIIWHAASKQQADDLIFGALGNPHVSSSRLVIEKENHR